MHELRFWGEVAALDTVAKHFGRLDPLSQHSVGMSHSRMFGRLVDIATHSSPAMSTVTLSGTDVDRLSGQPIQRARVGLFPQPIGVAPTQESDR